VRKRSITSDRDGVRQLNRTIRSPLQLLTYITLYWNPRETPLSTFADSGHVTAMLT
jgi:hypothetical protein